MDFEIERIYLDRPTRVLKAEWTIEPRKDLLAIHGLTNSTLPKFKAPKRLSRRKRRLWVQNQIKKFIKYRKQEIAEIAETLASKIIEEMKAHAVKTLWGNNDI